LSLKTSSLYSIKKAGNNRLFIVNYETSPLHSFCALAKFMSLQAKIPEDPETTTLPIEKKILVR